MSFLTYAFPAFARALRVLSAACMGGFGLSGCLYSTQHFHTGVLAPEGHGQATLGLGRQPLWRCSAPADSTARACNEDGSGSERVFRTEAVQASIDYRLGIADKIGPFPGAELEWHLEAPTNPASLEFSVNLGMPAWGSMRHMVGAGWGIGAWSDNSLFLEYAASRRLGIPLFFTNLRATLLATQLPRVLQDDFSRALPSERVLVVQSGFGVRFPLPSWRLAPDFVIPHFNLTYPQLPAGDRVFRGQDIPSLQWDMNLGLGWDW
jgi:hypothetical protein